MVIQPLDSYKKELKWGWYSLKCPKYVFLPPTMPDMSIATLSLKNDFYLEATCIRIIPKVNYY